MVSHTEKLQECADAFARFDKHIEESKEVRDRLLRVEIDLENVKKDVMKNAIIGAIIGGLIGSGASPAVTKLVFFWIGK